MAWPKPPWRLPCGTCTLDKQASHCISSWAAAGGASTAAFRLAFRTPSADLIKKIEKEVSAGYQRIKIKIKPGWDLDVVREVRRHSHPSF